MLAEGMAPAGVARPTKHSSPPDEVGKPICSALFVCKSGYASPALVKTVLRQSAARRAASVPRSVPQHRCPGTGDIVGHADLISLPGACPKAHADA